MNYCYCKAQFLASLLQSSVSHDPSEIILFLLLKKHFLLLSMLKTVVLLNNFNCDEQPFKILGWFFFFKINTLIQQECINSSKVIVMAFIMLQQISISNKRYKNIKQQNCF